MGVNRMDDKYTLTQIQIKNTNTNTYTHWSDHHTRVAGISLLHFYYQMRSMSDILKSATGLLSVSIG